MCIFTFCSCVFDGFVVHAAQLLLFELVLQRLDGFLAINVLFSLDNVMLLMSEGHSQLFAVNRICDRTAQ